MPEVDSYEITPVKTGITEKRWICNCGASCPDSRNSCYQCHKKRRVEE